MSQAFPVFETYSLFDKKNSLLRGSNTLLSFLGDLSVSRCVCAASLAEFSKAG